MINETFFLQIAFSPTIFYSMTALVVAAFLFLFEINYQISLQNCQISMFQCQSSY